MTERTDAAWMAERLRRVPAWRLGFFVIMPVGFAAVFLTGNMMAGHLVGAIVFGVLLVVSVSILAAALILRHTNPRQPS
jgi:hypothetical protein